MTEAELIAKMDETGIGCVFASRPVAFLFYLSLGVSGGTVRLCCMRTDILASASSSKCKDMYNG